MATDLRFYLDENVPVEIARQLRARGISAITARDLGTLGASDEAHLELAAAQGLVLCTNDADILRLAADGRRHIEYL